MKTPVRRHSQGFTMVELLVSTAVISLLMLLLVQITGATSRTWQYTANKTEQFREARQAFEAMTRRLSQATLNTYYDYYNTAGARRTQANSASFIPATYGRHSELKFLCGQAEDLLGSGAARPTHAVFFQAPLGYTEDLPKLDGLENLLNTWGYFLEFGKGDDKMPPFIASNLGQAGIQERYRYRLMELMEPTEALSVYGTSTSPKSWFVNPVQEKTNRPVRVLAENVVALVIIPRLSEFDRDAAGNVVKPEALAPACAYDSTATGTGTPASPHLNSKHQLPPIVQVSMVVLDETSAARLAEGKGDSPPVLTKASLDTGADLFRLAVDTLSPRNAGKGGEPINDVQLMEENLIAAKLNARVFTTNVSIRGAKWSTAYTK